MKKMNLQMSASQVHIASISFSEKDIIKLHQTFLTTGFHSIKTYNQRSGRILIKALLRSLNCYHHIACISSSGCHFKKSKNIYEKLEKLDSEALRSFVIQDANFDFLWIEKTADLAKAKLLSDFFKCLKEFHFDKTMPIITVSYTKELKKA